MPAHHFTASNHWLSLVMVASAMIVSVNSFANEASVSKDPAKLAFFESRIRPLLIKHCYECHSESSGESAGDLRLDTAAAMRHGGLTGPALVPGNVDESLLVTVVEYGDPDMQMPPQGKLSAVEIQDLRRWIAQGAIDPRDGEIAEQKPTPLSRDPKSHWAFNSPVQPQRDFVPEIRNATDPIDAWVAVAARDRSLTIAATADDATLIQRLYFDLTGLPPSRKQINDFVDDDSVLKYSRLVDRLLAMPDFGERFGRHWLDIARYADTRGYALAGQPRELEGSHRYRDWVINAFASDMPYDEMIQHQLAGDRTDPENENGHLDAMGFLTIGRRYLSPFDVADDRIDVVTRGLLGLTVSCARCHDHKFDPIPTADYYSLFGVMWSSQEPEDGVSPLMLVDKEKPRDERIFVRGQPGNRGDVAPRQFLTALRRPDEPRFRDGSGRFELAQRIADDDNPLTARIMVNRVWKILLGKPLVDSPSDFGFRTKPPAIPSILEELAIDFANDHSIKRLVRRIVMTHVYRQSAIASEHQRQLDPNNDFLTRANRRRKDFESLRDSMLSVAGHLDRRVGGKPVQIVADTPPPRRTTYAMVDRQNLPGLFRTFDFANPDAHSAGRYETTVPQQGLFMMNSPQVIQLGKWIAANVRFSDDVVGQLFSTILGRRPDASERRRFESFLGRPADEVPPVVDGRSLWSYGLASLSDDDRRRVTSFSPMTERVDGRFQPSIEFPVAGDFGHAFLSETGGHPPRPPSMASVRRYTAPADGQLTFRMWCEHPSEDGDGVRLETHLAGERKLTRHIKSGKQPVGPHHWQVRRGDVIDFVASAGETDHSDGFNWTIRLSLKTDDGRLIETQSRDDFSLVKPPNAPEPPSRLAQAAQVLLMSNEFAFVD